MTSQTETPTQDRAARWLRGPLRPFRNGQYRLLNGSVVFALVAGGTWIIALVWQVIAWGGGAAELSLVSTSGAVGMIAASLLGGVIADRIPQRRILLVVTAVRLVAIGTVAALALTGFLQVWMLAIVAFVIGVGNGFTFPAYSALLPMIVPEEDLLAVNGLEGAMRPVIGQVAGPALASAVVAAASPAAAIALVALFELAGLLCLIAMKPVALRRESEGHSAGALLTDLREGVQYMTRTAWLAATILFAAVLILLIMGPIEVLIPFLLKDRAGGGPGDHAIVLAAFGIGGTLGSLGMATRKLPRRYLTVMVSLWGLGCLPLVVVGVATNVWVIAGAVFVVGALFSAPMVIWGTLLQRRVPPALLGRVSSLDFFVSLVFMPVSIAMAGPVSKAIGLSTVFLIAGVVPLLLAVVAIVVAKLPQDEIAHPLDTEPVAEPKLASVTELPVRDDCDGVPCAQAA
ncbi:MFS transporter [Tenggerimyces flavus]|uniref:MFS transporter n=1 Tax=Tenggerimyces flavus TaxID=1708749 RepID=A0ABV7YJ80_9ACTN|nr:MFS transporter [Tenggerimyces flavus]MBM7787252.1 MFS family permease [Tenggerimyces flavus]